MARPYSCASALCPYYKQESQQHIYCSGFPGVASCHVTFATRKEHKEYRERYCYRHCTSCPMFKMLDKIYDSEN